MRSFKQIATTILLIISAFGAVLYTACSKDSCASVTCLNNSACSGGMCSCPAGTGGAACQIIYRNLYDSTYTGSAANDTGKTYLTSMAFMVPMDTVYVNMNLAIADSAANVFVTVPILLTNNTASGSNFTVTSTSGSFPDSATYTGTGSVSTIAASVNLTLSYPHSAARFVSLSNLTKK